MFSRNIEQAISKIENCGLLVEVICNNVYIKCSKTDKVIMLLSFDQFKLVGSKIAERFREAPL